MVLLVCKYKGLGEWVVVVVEKVNILGEGETFIQYVVSGVNTYSIAELGGG